MGLSRVTILTLLMLGNEGCEKRKDRKGIDFVTANLDLVADMTLQCLLVEVVRVPVLLEWSEVKKMRDGTTGCSLPLLADIDCFLDFIADVMTVNKFQTTRNLLQTQHDLHVGFGSTSTFTRVLKHLRDELRGKLGSLVHGVMGRKMDLAIDVFSVCKDDILHPTHPHELQ
jgi:hypothetical protein